MSNLMACDQLKAMSTQLTGLSELLSVLSEYEHPVPSEVYQFLSWSVERMGTECNSVADKILEDVQNLG